jgi:(E)-4-hydroxy-3-methylbut-2-enyl-diphosphate synthase
VLIKRKKTRVIRVGNLKIGGDNPVAVQSMVKNKLEDPDELKDEINELVSNGCELVRVAVPEKKSVSYLKSLIKNETCPIPIVADIQFDFRLALDCIDAGVDCVRINPGNIGGADKVAKVIEKAKQKKIAIRIGVNSGSINKNILRKNNGNKIDSVVESVLDSVRLFEKCKFYNFKISAKASSVTDTVNIYEILSEKVDYPLHLGITEAGPLFRGSIKSSVGLGILLSKGIGDTIRVSLTGGSVEEVKAAYIILNSLNLRKVGVDIVSCPTCGRTTVNLEQIANKIEVLAKGVKKNLKLAVMGCIVNGPGEAKDADLGIAFGREKAAIFVKGKVVRRVCKDIALEEFVKEFKKNL